MNQMNKLSSISLFRLLFTALVPTSLLLPRTTLFVWYSASYTWKNVCSATYFQLLSSYTLKEAQPYFYLLTKHWGSALI